MSDSGVVNIIGGGSLGMQVADILLSRGEKCDIVVYDDNPELMGKEILPGILVKGSIDCILKKESGSSVVIAVASTSARRTIFRRLQAKGFNFLNVVHPAAVISRYAVVGEGNILFPGVVVDPAAQIGSFVVFNKNCSVGHNAEIGDFVTFTPNCSVACPVSSGAFIGMGARLLPGTGVGENSIIGAGSVVTKPIPGGVTAVGAPARITK